MKKGVTKEELVRRLAFTLRATREGVADLVLVNEDTVLIIYRGGYSKKVNIACNSGLAIIRDVCRAI